LFFLNTTPCAFARICVLIGDRSEEKFVMILIFSGDKILFFLMEIFIFRV